MYNCSLVPSPYFLHCVHRGGGGGGGGEPGKEVSIVVLQVKIKSSTIAVGQGDSCVMLAFHRTM